MIHSSTDIGLDVEIGIGTTIWHLSQVRENAIIGQGCSLGRGVYVGPGVVIGDNCKIQNFALIYEPARIESGVFIGPGAVLTNDLRPRAITPEGRPKGPADWESVGVNVGVGASIGARVVCVAPVKIGDWALIGAGSVVIKDVPDHALVVGNPARQIGWACQCGRRLFQTGRTLMCSTCNSCYERGENGLAVYGDL
jgi:acetyltransferase-like isoleucine patch superfamily enzyme